MNLISLLKTYLRWKPEIKEVEGAIEDAKQGHMKTAWEKIMEVLEPLLWTVGGAVASSVANYLSAAHQPSLNELKAAALAGAGIGFTAYMRTPRHKNGNGA